MLGTIVFGEYLLASPMLGNESVDLVYIDPPFNTGKIQKRTYIKTTEDAEGDRNGFQDKRYKSDVVRSSQFVDSFDDYLDFLRPALIEAWRVLKPSGSLYVHLDYREVHHVKVELDAMFGREHFLNEIVWCYDYGAKSKRRWSPKHDNILLYVKDPKGYYFDHDEVDRIPYMAPLMVGEEKAKRGKCITSAMWHTIVSPTGKEKLGYATQKPVGLVSRFVRVSCPKGGLCVDFFAGAGTLGAAAEAAGRRFWMCDASLDAMRAMRQRFASKLDLIDWKAVQSPGRLMNMPCGIPEALSAATVAGPGTPSIVPT